MPNEKISLGKLGEKIAKRYLRLRFYKIVKTNYRQRFGEIDLICQKGKTLIFTEVKTRSNQACGWPEEAVTTKKINRIIAAGQNYLVENNLSLDWQIDIISIIINPQNKKAAVTHLKDIKLY